MNNALIKTKVKNLEILEKAEEFLNLIGVEIISVEIQENQTEEKDKPNLTNFHQKMKQKFGEMPSLSPEEAKEVLNKYYQNHA